MIDVSAGPHRVRGNDSAEHGSRPTGHMWSAHEHRPDLRRPSEIRRPLLHGEPSNAEDAGG
ncbi:hypothetical protein DKM19_06115 [Streptosporangium sp. 'caverna']|nr:hypothetical protein DKM19_06115 [Streptosporangium sp. 'caverna']